MGADGAFVNPAHPQFEELRGLLTQSPRLGIGHTLLQRRLGLLKNRLRKPEAGQQPPRSAVAHARGQRQTQPSPQLFMVHGFQATHAQSGATASYRDQRPHPHEGARLTWD